MLTTATIADATMTRRSLVRLAAMGATALLGTSLAGLAAGTTAKAGEAADAGGAADAAGQSSAADSVSAEQPSPAYQVAVYDLGGARLHAFGTLDSLGNVCYLVEGPDALVGIEMPAFTEDLEAWSDYGSALGKPLAGIFTDDHATGGSYVEGVRVYATQNAKDSQLSGSVHATTSGLAQTFGDDFHADVPTVTDIVANGDVTVGGIDFTVIDDGDTYRLAIPSMNVIYMHMLGATTHSILPSVEAIDAMVAQLRGYQEAGYGLVLSSHHMPEGQRAVAAKIAYLGTAKELAASCGSAEEFVGSMTEAFPGYDGANYLEMSAGYLFPAEA